MKRGPLQLGTLAALVGLLFIGAGPANATHAWNGYHWSRPNNPFTVTLGSNVSSTWSSHLATAAAGWSLTSGSCNNPSNPVRCAVAAGGSRSRNCRPADGRVEVCNATYGNTGWLGIAGIYVSGDHITKGYVKVNDTYHNSPPYNTPAWRQFVMSQEVGHTLGLAHQDEDFNNPDLLDACGRGSCMDYSSDPTNNTTPNQHDYDELVIIYSHLDGAALIAGGPADDGLDLETPSAWGQAKRFDSKGRGIEFERQLAAGSKLVTFVLWAD
jgi:hypothetical protein